MVNNKYILWGVLIVVVFSIGFFALKRNPDVIKNFPSKGQDIVAYGDSLVVGTGATPDHDFVSLLSAEIGEPIYNLGVSGDTTEAGLTRIMQLDEYSPKVVILLLGGNDYLQHVPIDNTFANLGLIIAKMQAKGAIVLLVGIRGGVVSDPFAARFAELAKQYHTAYVPDALSGLFGKKEYMSDEVHPNDKGYEILASRILPVLQPLLK